MDPAQVGQPNSTTVAAGPDPSILLKHTNPGHPAPKKMLDNVVENYHMFHGSGGAGSKLASYIATRQAERMRGQPHTILVAPKKGSLMAYAQHPTTQEKW